MANLRKNYECGFQRSFRQLLTATYVIRFESFTCSPWWKNACWFRKFIFIYANNIFFCFCKHSFQ
ncbi:unnamed protein product [Brassica oleracea]